MILGMLFLIGIVLFGIAFVFSAVGLLLRILYFICIALPISLVLGAVGIVLCCTIIGIPLGLLCLKGAGSMFLSFL